MKRNCILSIFFVTALLIAFYTYAINPDQNTIPFPPELKDRHKIIQIFLEAVDRQEVVVLGQPLDRSMIRPARVEYIYELDKIAPKIMIYSTLIKPITIPSDDLYELEALSITMHPDGRILEVKAHVWPKQE